jgi:hypothetical protein
VPYSNHELTVLERFCKTPDGQALLGVLRAKLAEADAKLRKAQGEDLVRTQGRAVCLEELIEDIARAGERLNRTPASRSAYAAVRTPEEARR